MKTKTVKKVKKVEKIKPDTTYELDVYFEDIRYETAEITLTKDELLRFLEGDDELREEKYYDEVWGDITGEHINYNKIYYDLGNESDKKKLLKLLSN